MAKHVAFLRAINVGGRNVGMADLRRHFEALGCASVETHIASGNVLFESRKKDEAALECMLEAGLEERLGFTVSVFVRSCTELRSLPAWPFAERPATASNIIFLKEPLNEEQTQRLHDLGGEVDAFELRGRHIAWVCAVKQSESKFSNALLERKLKIESTIRARKTVADIIRRFCD